MNAVSDDETAGRDGTASERTTDGTSTGIRRRDAAAGTDSSRDEPISAVFFDGSATSYGGGSEMVYRLLTRVDRSVVRPQLLAHTDDELCRRLHDEVAVDVVPYRGSLDQFEGGVLDQPAYRSIGTALRILQFNVEARATLREADVLWCMNLRSLLTVAPFAAVTDTPVIWNVGLGQRSVGVYRHLNELGLRLADRVFIESEEQARRVFTDEQYAQHADSFRVFAKGIDVDRFAPDRVTPPLSTPPYAIGTVASITPRKGLDVFLDAAIALLEERDDLTVHVAGRPPGDADQEYARDLRRRVAAAGHDDSVTFHGWVDDVAGFYDRLDAFVLASRNEGVPGAVREALAAERPVVATDVGGTREAVRDGETGLLVPPNDPDALAEALRSLLANPATARQLGVAGREHVQRAFSVDAYVDHYEAFLQEVVDA